MTFADLGAQVSGRKRPLARRVRKVGIRLGAQQHKSGVAAPREAEEAHALAIDPVCKSGSVQHEVDQRLDVGRPLGEVGDVLDAARLRPAAVDRVVDGRNDEARVRDRRGRVVMTARPTSASVRHDDERPLAGWERTVSRAEKLAVANDDFGGGRVTRRPDDPPERSCGAIDDANAGCDRGGSNGKHSDKRQSKTVQLHCGPSRADPR